MSDRVHAFTDDALGDHDAVALAELAASAAVRPDELAAAALARADAVNPQLNAIAYRCPAPRHAASASGVWYGVPAFVKDNADVAGLPSCHGSAAVTPHPAGKDDRFTAQLLSTGITVLGKTTMPEFGFTSTTEFESSDPTRNPWDTGYTVGGSSGGSAAMVAAGVVPVAHGNDGGGSLRIPAACAGLVSLKPSRFRHLDNAQARQLPIKLVSEGVLTRSVRDQAAYHAAAEKYWRNPKLPPIGAIEGPSARKLRIGLLTTACNGREPDAATAAAVHSTAAILEAAGHSIEPMTSPVAPSLVDDFLRYWGFLAQMSGVTGKLSHGRSFDAARLDAFTKGLAASFRRRLLATPGSLYRLNKARADYDEVLTRYDVILSPVLTHTTPELGYLRPGVPFDELLDRVTNFVGYTPINNVTGSPSIAVPAGLTDTGLPVGVMLSGAYGDERTLLELAFLLEAQRPFPRITES
ncbi:amidase [Nocardia flavorosea]|uniref:amidase n=1 Tax=Nocardia flavorosea TaxID=53429 RepID=A0A846YIG5_9NOCA|nr:amidase [Nocardia flavorosea]NKY58693.1 amidase [Nocardia flavorosea]